MNLLGMGMLQKHFFAVFGVALLFLWSFTNIRALASTAATNTSAATNNTSNNAVASWLQGESISM